METFVALLAFCEGNLPVDSSYKDQWRGDLIFRAPERTVEQTVDMSVIWDAIALIVTL